MLRRLGPSWSASPVRRLVQAGFFLLFLGLFFHVAWPYGSKDYSQLLQQKERIDAELFLNFDPLVGLSAALAGRAWVGSLLWAAGVLGVCVALPRFFCGYACPLGTLIDLFDWAINSPVRRLLRRVGPRRGVSNAGVGGGTEGSPAREGGGVGALAETPPGSRRGLQRHPHADARGFRDTPVLPHGASESPPAFRRGLHGLRNLRYFILAGVLASSALGVLTSGYVAAIPVVTRGLQFTVSLAELGLRRGWHQVPPLNPGYALSIALFAGILILGLARPRFWCRYVCPSGALISLVSRLGLTQRKLSTACTGCGRCERACSFDAIGPRFTTRLGDCTLCQTCAGVCPVGAIHFAPRWHSNGNGSSPARLAGRAFTEQRRLAGAPAAAESGMPSQSGAVSRRGFLLGLAAGGSAGLASAAGVRMLSPALAEAPVRPPGSVPEREFLRLCVRCGECFRVCPNNVLQPMGFRTGLDNLWTPAVAADWSGCEPTCNNCGKVCPTGAIRPLALAEKRVTRIALAVLNERTCLQCRGQSACETTGRDGRPSLLCRDECESAGYHAIDLVRMGVETDSSGLPVEGSGYLVPLVSGEKCIGCGMCQTRCYKINVHETRVLGASAIRMVAGPGKEDRLSRGSVLDLRGRGRGGKGGAPRPAASDAGASAGHPASQPATSASSDYVTDF